MINVLIVVYLVLGAQTDSGARFHAALSEMASFQDGPKWFRPLCEYRTCQTCNKIGSKIKFSMTRNKITVL